MDRLQTHARRQARGAALGLGALAQTLTAPPHPPLFNPSLSTARFSAAKPSLRLRP